MDGAGAVETLKRFGLGEMMFAHITRHHAPRPFRSEAVEAKAVRALLTKIDGDYANGGGNVRLGGPPIFVAGQIDEYIRAKLGHVLRGHAGHEVAHIAIALLRLWSPTCSNSQAIGPNAYQRAQQLGITSDRKTRCQEVGHSCAAGV